MNPLNKPNTPFRVDMKNPSITYSHSRGYRLSVELEPDTWRNFENADLKGMILTASMCVVDESGQANPLAPEGLTPQPEKKPPTGQRCREAIGLINNPHFQLYVESIKKRFTDRSGVDAYLKDYCEVGSKRDFDEHLNKAYLYKRFQRLQHEFEDWWESFNG